ncbi:MAG: acyltransferase family protein [Bacillus sp. (in: Bacteria)]|nr:acyltransferase family protein [Bacillus sp. (in: firmicutes)]MCM1426863.1 acyltransferase family protein [Eubacterium sp.]
MNLENRSDKDQKYNMTFCILSGIAIVMIVAGHVGYNILTVGELFPYYSFHVPLFLFISGYFYKEEEEAAPLAYSSGVRDL